MKAQIDVNRFVAREDVSFVLEPTVKALLAHGIKQRRSQRRSPRVSSVCLSDAGQKVSVAELDRQAAQIVRALVEEVQGKTKKAA